MKFKKYFYDNQEVLIESLSIKDWSSVSGKSKELKNGVEILKQIEKKGYKAYIVGGSVRDLLLNKPADDVDIATDMPANEIEELFDTHDIGKNKQFGVVVVNYKGGEYEIANFRMDQYSGDTSGKGADTIKIAKDFKSDAARRDLTINSLGVDSKGKISDHFSGTKDLENKIIKAVGDPNVRFSEDFIRLLRTIRFSNRFDFKIDPETKKALQKNAHNIKKVSPERIAKELLKMAKEDGTKFANAILLMDEVGLLKHILPEVSNMKNFKHDPKHHPEGAYVRRIL